MIFMLRDSYSNCHCLLRHVEQAGKIAHSCYTLGNFLSKNVARHQYVGCQTVSLRLHRIRETGAVKRVVGNAISYQMRMKNSMGNFVRNRETAASLRMCGIDENVEPALAVVVFANHA